MRSWSYWFPDVLPHVAGCPEVLAEHELRRAAQAFFGLTRAWRVVLPTKPVQAGTVSVVAAPADDQQELVMVEAAWLDGKQLDPITPAELDATHSEDWELHTGTPAKYLQLTPGVLRLYPMPVVDASTGLKLRVSVKPSDASLGFPDELATEFKDPIQIGAKARLMVYKKPWQDLTLAGVYATAFDAAVNTTKTQVAKAYVRARVSTRTTWC